MNIETIVIIIIVACLYEFGYRKYLASKIEKFIMLRKIKYGLDKEYSIQLGLNKYAINIEYKYGLEMLLIKNTPSSYNEVLYSENDGRSEIVYFNLENFKNKCIDIIYTDYRKNTIC